MNGISDFKEGKYKCYYCLCDACTKFKCPVRYGDISDSLSICIKNGDKDQCPKIKCEFFEPKFRKKYFKIKHIKKREDVLIEAIKRVEKKIDEILLDTEIN